MSFEIMEGPHLVDQIQSNDGYILPIGLLSRLGAKTHDRAYLNSQMSALRSLYESLLGSLKSKGTGEYSDNMFLLISELGLVVNPQQKSRLDLEMRQKASEIGSNFLAFYELMNFESSIKFNGDEDDEDDADTKSLEQVYRRLLKETLKDWSVADLSGLLKNSISALKNYHTQGDVFSLVRVQQMIDVLKLPEEFRSIAVSFVNLSTLSLIHPSRVYDLSTALSGVFGSFQSSGEMPERGDASGKRLWLSTLQSLFPKEDVELLKNFTSQKGWLMIGGFFNSRYASWTSNLLSFQSEGYAWRAIIETSLDEDFRQALINQGLRSLNVEDKLTTLLSQSSDFSFLGRDLQLLQSIFNSDRPMRVLISGTKGSGRHALVQFVTKDANKDVFLPKEHHGAGSMAPFYSLASAQTAGILLKNNVLLMEKFPHIDQKDSANIYHYLAKVNQNLHEVWLSSSIEDVESQMIDMFDLVIQMPVMPIRQRVTLAEKLLGTDLAEKVSQSTTLPGEIVEMAEWSNRMGVKDWNALSASLLGVQRARLKKSNIDGDLPLQLYPPNSIEHGFEAVIGEDENIKKAKELSEALKSPLLYEKMGVKPPKGLLLLGPPGTGKTHLARAIAKDAGVNLLLANAAGMAQKPESIHGVFNEARKQSPCILFIDEIDAVGTTAGQNADPNRQSILNRLLTELDGFEALDGVLVIGATHRGDLLDNAITRSGRLGHSISFKRPERPERVLLWKHYTKNMSVSKDIDWEKVGKVSTGMTPADIQMCANNAGLHALRHHSEKIETRNLLAAIEDMLWGEYRDNIPMEKDELYRTCVHEAGHAMVSFFHQLEMDRVCVRPRGESLGFVRFTPQEGRYGMLQGDIMARIGTALSGGLAEQVVFSSHGTGVVGDLMQVRSLAFQAVRVSGMHPSLPAGVEFSPFAPPPSIKLQIQAEKAEHEIVESCQVLALNFLSENKDALIKLAKWLKKEREIEGREVEKFLESEIGAVSRPFARTTSLLQAARCSSVPSQPGSASSKKSN